jgi:predicted ATPase
MTRRFPDTPWCLSRRGGAHLRAGARRERPGGGHRRGAGRGESRLCYEFVERCRALAIPVLEGHGVPHGKTIPLLPWLEIHRSRFGITERDSDETARNKIAGFMLRSDPELAGSASVMFEFLGVPDPREPAVHLRPEVMQREITEITKRLIVARTRRNESGVVLFEDLHWFDAASEKAQAAVLDAIPPNEARTLALCTFRPGYRAAWMEKPVYLELPLLPLGPDAIVDLLRDLLGSDPSVAGLADHVRARTARGMPPGHSRRPSSRWPPAGASPCGSSRFQSCWPARACSSRRRARTARRRSTRP